MNSLGKITLKPSKKALRYAHPWMYRSQCREAELKNCSSGSLVKVFTAKNRFLGIGYANPLSEISIRMLTSLDESVSLEFFKSRIEKAFEFRKRFVRDTNAFRLISSEADGLPGVIIDRYADVLVVQFLTFGMEKLKGLIIQALEEIFPNFSIYEKSDSSSRRREGLEETDGWIKSGPEEVEIYEGGIRYLIHFGQGHKTGFYLDQRENRLLLASLGLRGKVLDAFCYSGGFGLHLAKSGCEVMALDSQAEAIALALANGRLNGIDASFFRVKQANVFDELKNMEKQKSKFDLVILDPPSFVKRREALTGALSGFKEIILRSIKILNEGGFLAVFSCSYHVDENLLLKTGLSASIDLRKDLRIIKFMRQSADHPIHPFIPETYYLKGYLFQITSL